MYIITMDITTPIQEKKTKKTSPSIYGGRFGRIFFSIFKNVNKNNVSYFRISFSTVKGPGMYANLPIAVNDLANLQAALDAARLWLRRGK